MFIVNIIECTNVNTIHVFIKLLILIHTTVPNNIETLVTEVKKPRVWSLPR